MKYLPQFIASYNLAYTNRFKFFHFRIFCKLILFLKMFQQKGLIWGFFIKNELVIIQLKYIFDFPFFRFYFVSKYSRKLFFKSLDFIKGKLANTSLFLLTSSNMGFFFSEVFYFQQSKSILSQMVCGGEIILKIVFFNVSTTKSSFF